MRRTRRLLLVGVLALLTTSWAQAEPSEVATAESRHFEFVYGASIAELPPGARVRVWVPQPPSNEYQQVQVTRDKFPARVEQHQEPKFGNQIRYFELAAPTSGKIEFQTVYDVERQEVRGLTRRQASALTESQKQLLTAPNSKIPVGGRPLELLRGIQLPTNPLDLGRTLYDRVDEHVKYDKTQLGYGEGDVLWVCDSRTGNCTDFHSLFIALARSFGIPAQFEIGFPIPTERGEGAVGGYHCWAFFYVDQHGWVPVDISEADKQPALKDYYFGNLTEDRITFSAGRDIELMPRQDSEPLNYFVYPHVEVNGKRWPKEKIQLQFAYRDFPSK